MQTYNAPAIDAANNHEWHAVAWAYCSTTRPPADRSPASLIAERWGCTTAEAERAIYSACDKGWINTWSVVATGAQVLKVVAKNFLGDE